jgi:hypothetical protein
MCWQSMERSAWLTSAEKRRIRDSGERERFPVTIPWKALQLRIPLRFFDRLDNQQQDDRTDRGHDQLAEQTVSGETQQTENPAAD